MSKGAGDRLAGAVSWLDARGHGFAAVFLAAMTLALYHNALSGWWTYDDPLHLKEAILHSPVDYFFIPSIWQEFQGAFFTPLLTLSYDLDYSIFGLEPALFYGHQLASVALAAFSFYLLLNLWVSRSFALLGAMLMLMSPPLALASSWLAIRHYVEGLALASFAVCLWVVGLRHQKPAYQYASAILYLLAMLAKEVYVPLVVMLVMLPERSWRERSRFSWSLWAVLVIYLAWRFWMLGGQFGGYGVFWANWEAVPDVVVLAVLLLPFTFFVKLFGVNWALPLWIGVFGAMIAAWARGSPAKRLGFALAVLVLISAPLIPVVSSLRPEGVAQEQRFVMVPAAIFILSLILGLSRFEVGSKERVFLLFIVAVVSAGLWAQSRAMLGAWKDPEIQRLEGKFLLERKPETDILSVSFSNTNYFYRGIHWLRGHFGSGPAPVAVYGGYFGLRPDYDVRQLAQRIYRYELSCGCLRDVTEAVVGERQKFMSRIVDRPLHAKLDWGQGALAWKLGPYEKGKYFLIAGQQPGWYSSGRDVGRQGSIAYMLEGYMRVGYESPEGWIALSPEFHVSLAEHGHFEWNSHQVGPSRVLPDVSGT